MDCRVKPGNDDGAGARPQLVIRGALRTIFFVIPGCAESAGPESIATILGRLREKEIASNNGRLGLWIPGSPRCGAPE
jgi:hypothetical protein